MHEQALIWRKNKKEKKRKKTLQPVKKGPIKAEKLQTWKWLAGDSDRKICLSNTLFLSGL